MSKRIKALSLAVFLILTLISCSKSPAQNETEKSESVQTDIQTETTTESNEYTFLDDVNLEGYNFRVLGYMDFDNGNTFVPDEATGDIIFDTAYQRNKLIEEKYNVLIKMTDGNGRGSVMLSKTVLAGEDSYDICIIHTGAGDNAISLVESKSLMNLNTVPYFDFEDSCYIPTLSEILNVKDIRYLGGSYYVSPDLSPLYLVFNYKLADSFGIDDIYDSVDDGTWTWEKFLSCINGVYSDLDGDGEKSVGDLFGYYNLTGLTNYMISGFDVSTTYKDEKGYQMPLLSGDKLLSTIQTLCDFGSLNPDVYQTTSMSGTHQFQDGKALFSTNGTGWLSFRDIEDFDFGVAPFPKYDELQSQYYSFSGPNPFCVPITVQNIQACGIVMDALTRLSYSDLNPVYTEVYMEQKILRDQKSVDIYRMLSDSCLSDFTRYMDYSGGNLSNYKYVAKIVSDENVEAASYLASIEESVNNLAVEFFNEYN